MADFNIRIISSLANGATSPIIALDTARNRDISATFVAGAIPGSGSFTVQAIQASGKAVQDKTGEEDPITVFGDVQRIYSKTYSSPDTNTWSVSDTLLGRFTHMRIINNAGAPQTFTVTF